MGAKNSHRCRTSDIATTDETRTYLRKTTNVIDVIEYVFDASLFARCSEFWILRTGGRFDFHNLIFKVSDQCLWKIIVIDKLYRIDFEQEFGHMYFRCAKCCVANVFGKAGTMPRNGTAMTRRSMCFKIQTTRCLKNLNAVVLRKAY